MNMVTWRMMMTHLNILRTFSITKYLHSHFPLFTLYTLSLSFFFLTHFFSVLSSSVFCLFCFLFIIIVFKKKYSLQLVLFIIYTLSTHFGCSLCFYFGGIHRFYAVWNIAVFGPVVRFFWRIMIVSKWFFSVSLNLVSHSYQSRFWFVMASKTKNARKLYL